MNRNGIRRKWKIENRAFAAFSIVYFLLSPSAAHAISDNAGTKAGAFLKIPTDARGVAMGATMVSLAKGTEGMRWNPAGLAFTTSKEVAATHIEYYQDVSIENVSYAHPFNMSGLGANLFYLGSGDMEGRDSAGLQTGDFSAYDLVLGLGYGGRLRSRDEIGMDLYLGGQLKVIQEKIADTKYNNAAVDLGLMLDPSDTLHVGLTARNLSTGKADFPLELTGGLSYDFLPIFTSALALGYTNDAPVRISLAGEYRMPQLENSVLRLGYHTRDELDDSLDAKISWLRSASLAGLTFGGGLEMRPPQFKTLHFVVDYTMAPFGALGISHTVTVKVRW